VLFVLFVVTLPPLFVLTLPPFRAFRAFRGHPAPLRGHAPVITINQQIQ